MASVGGRERGNIWPSALWLNRPKIQVDSICYFSIWQSINVSTLPWCQEWTLATQPRRGFASIVDNCGLIDMKIHPPFSFFPLQQDAYFNKILMFNKILTETRNGLKRNIYSKWKAKFG